MNSSNRELSMRALSGLNLLPASVMVSASDDGTLHTPASRGYSSSQVVPPPAASQRPLPPVPSPTSGSVAAPVLSMKDFTAGVVVGDAVSMPPPAAPPRNSTEPAAAAPPGTARQAVMSLFSKAALKTKEKLAQAMDH